MKHETALKSMKNEGSLSHTRRFNDNDKFSNLDKP